MKLIVDRIEGETAVVTAADDASTSFSVPVRYLPEGTREGDHLQLSFTRDEVSRKAARDRVESLLDELTSKD
jgi:hypothetical protein